jgi:hypothetical protein
MQIHGDFSIVWQGFCPIIGRIFFINHWLVVGLGPLGLSEAAMTL